MSIPPELQLENKLDGYRLNRLQNRFHSLLKGVTLGVTNPDRTLQVICSPERLNLIQERFVDLRLQAFYIVGVWKIDLYCNADLIQTVSTLPMGETWHKLRKTAIEDFSMSVEAPVKQTRQPRSTRKSPQSATSVQTLPQLDDLSALAQKTGKSPEAIAQAILSKGYPAGINVRTQSYEADIEGIQAWTDEFLAQDIEQYRNQRRNDLLGVRDTTTNGANRGLSDLESATTETTTSAEQTAKPKTRVKTEKPSSKITSRFRNFQKANSYKRTIGKFLEAQGWDAEKRTEVIEAIAVLPSEPTDLESFTEKCMTKIVSAYPKAKQAIVRPGLIEAAKEILGEPSQTQVKSPNAA